jgi:peptidoglycan/LPS O-acetylase OafA/YrhL
MRATAKRQTSIDAMRGLAALAVVVFHFAGHSRRYFVGFPFSFVWGHYGVDFFFVISGYYIFATVQKSRSAVSFLYARLSRLMPAYWAAIVFGALVEAAFNHRGPWLPALAANLLFARVLTGFPHLDIVFWSLQVEAGFYLLMAALLTLGALRRPASAGLVWLVISLCIVWPGAGGEPAAKPGLQPLWDLLVYAPLFVLGMMIYRLNAEPQQPRRLVYAAMLLAVATMALQSGLERAGVAVLAGAAVLAASSGRLPWLANPLTVWLGGLSYSLYLVHRNLGYALMFKLHEMGLDSRLAALIALAVALLVAAVIHRWIELPSLAWLRSRNPFKADKLVVSRD